MPYLFILLLSSFFQCVFYIFLSSPHSFSLFLLIRIANASLPLLESKKAFDVALHRPSLLRSATSRIQVTPARMASGDLHIHEVLDRY